MNNITTDGPNVEMLTVRQAASRGILPEMTLRKLIARKKIPVICSGKVQYINYTLLVRMLNDPNSTIWR